MRATKKTSDYGGAPTTGLWVPPTHLSEKDRLIFAQATILYNSPRRYTFQLWPAALLQECMPPICKHGELLQGCLKCHFESVEYRSPQITFLYTPLRSTSPPTLFWSPSCPLPPPNPMVPAENPPRYRTQDLLSTKRPPDYPTNKSGDQVGGPPAKVKKGGRRSKFDDCRDTPRAVSFYTKTSPHHSLSSTPTDSPEKLSPTCSPNNAPVSLQPFQDREYSHSPPRYMPAAPVLPPERPRPRFATLHRPATAICQQPVRYPSISRNTDAHGSPPSRQVPAPHVDTHFFTSFQTLSTRWVRIECACRMAAKLKEIEEQQVERAQRFAALMRSLDENTLVAIQSNNAVTTSENEVLHTRLTLSRPMMDAHPLTNVSPAAHLDWDDVSSECYLATRCTIC